MIQCFAPDRNQMQVVNHCTGEASDTETRNVLQESSRIARGNIKPLEDLKSNDWDAVFLAGGFGYAKNFSDFAVKGAEMTVEEDVSSVLKDFHSNQKYIGLVCISPIIAAKVFGKASGGPGIKLTLGCKGDQWPHQGAIDAAQSFGNELVECHVTEVCHDEKNRIVTSPAYMYGDANSADVFDSVTNMVNTLVGQIKSSKIIK